MSDSSGLNTASKEEALPPVPLEKRPSDVPSDDNISGPMTKIGVYARLCNFCGFSTPYNFPLWIIFAGGLLGFSLSRLPDYDFENMETFSGVPGDWYYYGFGKVRIGLIIHLSCILPAGILVVLQFTPIIRHKWILFHRINGYLILLLTLLSTASAIVVSTNRIGGAARVSTQVAEGLLAILTVTSLVSGWVNIRRKQIEQHRKWMMRAWVYMGAIITSRILVAMSGPILDRIGTWWNVWTCDELDFMYNRYELPFPADRYPTCLFPNGTVNLVAHVAVQAAIDLEAPEGIATAYHTGYGGMLWLCLVLHIVLLEVYFSLTRNETERLRQVSYERQLEAGFENPGSAGLTSDRLGDTPKWRPA